MSIGTTSLRARPTSSDERDSGETSSRSCEPVMISWVRLAPVNDAPISAVIAMMPGTNHWSAEPSSTLGSSGANSAEEHQRLHHREQHGRRLAEHRPELADHHVPGVGDEAGCPELGRTASRGARGHVQVSISVVMPPLLRSRCPRSVSVVSLLSRRLRPVRSRKTSSRVGADDLDPLRPGARPGEVGDQAGRPARAPRATRIGDRRARPLDDAAAAEPRHGQRRGRQRRRLVGEAERDQVAERRT